MHIEKDNNLRIQFNAKNINTNSEHCRNHLEPRFSIMQRYSSRLNHDAYVQMPEYDMRRLLLLKEPRIFCLDYKCVGEILF